jgi:hypothetical protein
MSRRRFALCSSILVTLATYGCSPAADGSSSTSVGDAEIKTDSPFVFETEEADSSPSVIDDSASPESSVDTAPICTKTSETDEPDDDFADSNCDGIDGDKSKAVFVATTGSDDAAGSMEAPFKTLGRALKAGKDVYVCNGTYAENVVVDTNAARVFGGYDCKDSWKRTLERATIAPSKGIPLVVAKVASGAVHFDRVTLRAPDGVEPGDSSIAAAVSESKNVTFVNARITAGDAADGRAGEGPTAITTAATTGGDGFFLGTYECRRYGINPVSCSMVAKGGNVTSAAPECELAGGKGGNGGMWAVSDTARVEATPGSYGLGAKGAAPSISAGAGLPGGAGSDGMAGVSSSAQIGTFHALGYTATNDGTDGVAGTSGSGGSGGWGGKANWIGSGFPEYWYNGGGGGQGGFGGCGGAPGKKGTGGGASIALISWNSEIKLTKTTLDTGSGGRGGNGSSGAEGQAGGLGGKGAAGTAIGYGSAYDGGPGGRGGRGGAGGGGGGGPSIGIAVIGTEPARDAVTFNLGKPGAGGMSATGTAAAGAGKDVFVVSKGS